MTNFITYTVVLNYNNYLDTIECIQSLLKLSGADKNRIVIIDNLSQNKSCAYIENWLEQCGNEYSILDRNLNNSDITPGTSILFVKNNENKGYASGNNVGIKLALSDAMCKYVWILNNDTTVDINCLANQLDFYANAEANNRKLGMLGSKILYYYSPEKIQCIGCRYNKFFGIPRQIGLNKADHQFSYDNKPFDYITGASIFSPKIVFSECGLLNEDFFLYFEEIDFATRMKSRGYNIDVCLSSIVYHKEGASTKENIGTSHASPFSDYHFTKSKLIFTKSFYPQYVWFNYLSFVLVVANRLRKGRFSNISAILKAMFER